MQRNQASSVYFPYFLVPALFAVTSKWLFQNMGMSTLGRSREMLLPLYYALMRPHFQHWMCCIQLSGPQNKKDLDLLEWVRRRAMKMIKRLDCLSCENRLGKEGSREIF